MLKSKRKKLQVSRQASENAGSSLNKNKELLSKYTSEFKYKYKKCENFEKKSYKSISISIRWKRIIWK